LDRAGDVEDDGPRPARRLNAIPEAAGASVIQVGDVVSVAPVGTQGTSPEPFRLSELPCGVTRHRDGGNRPGKQQAERKCENPAFEWGGGQGSAEAEQPSGGPAQDRVGLSTREAEASHRVEAIADEFL